MTDIITQVANTNAYSAIPAIQAPANAIFKIKNAKLYVPVVTLSAQDDNKFLEQLKPGF